MTRDEIEAQQLAADLALELGKEMKLREEWQRSAEGRLQHILGLDARIDAIRLTLQRHYPEAFESVHKYIMCEDHG